MDEIPVIKSFINVRFGMLIAAHALGLGTLWFTLFEKERTLYLR